MNATTRRLVRLLARWQNRRDELEARFSETAEQDAAFDGGEFSGPAIARAFEKAADRLAQHYGFRSDDLAADVAHFLGVRCSACDNLMPDRSYFGIHQDDDGIWQPIGGAR